MDRGLNGIPNAVLAPSSPISDTSVCQSKALYRVTGSVG